MDLTATYGRLSQNKSIKSVALLEPIIGDNLGPILSKFHDILRCYKRAEQDFDEKLIHNGSNIRSKLNDRRHDTPFISNPDPTFNRAVGKPDIRSTDRNSFIQLIIGFIREQRDEVRLELKVLLKELKLFAISKSLDYHKSLPQDPSWLVRRLRSYRDILKEASLILDMHRSNGRRYII